MSDTLSLHVLRARYLNAATQKPDELFTIRGADLVRLLGESEPARFGEAKTFKASIETRRPSADTPPSGTAFPN